MSSCSTRQKVELPNTTPTPIRHPEPGEIIQLSPGDSLYITDKSE